MDKYFNMTILGSMYACSSYTAAMIAVCGLAVGTVLGAALVRYGMSLAERAFYSARTGTPGLSRYDADEAIEQERTDE